jgi:hypothetical protein
MNPLWRYWLMSIGYMLLASFMALLSFTSLMNLGKQFSQANFFNNATNFAFIVFLIGTSVAGLIYLTLAIRHFSLSRNNIKCLQRISFIALLPALLWFLWMFLFHLGL